MPLLSPTPRPGAQWTGIATRLGERWLETGAVDAVLAVAPAPQDRWRPRRMRHMVPAHV